MSSKTVPSETGRPTVSMQLQAAQAEARLAAGFADDKPRGVDDAYAASEAARAITTANRKLLQAYCPDALHPSTTVFSGIVWKQDQATRLQWFLSGLTVFCISSVLVNLNATSSHGYYAAKTAESWIEAVPGVGRDIPLCQLDTTHVGRPYHLMTGCVRHYGRRRDSLSTRDRSGFLFSKRFCGSDRTGYLPTPQFMKGTFTLPDAIAASGGAVSPTEFSNPLVVVLLVLSNFRLGQWIVPVARDDSWIERVRSFWPFSPARWLWSLCWCAEDRRHALVTDGGYYENLGVEALLQRRCKLIIAVDAGQDERHEFADFVRLVRRARMIYGIKLDPIDGAVERDLIAALALPEVSQASDQSRRGGSDKHSSVSPAWAKSHFITAHVSYPDCAVKGLLVYVKSSMTGDEPLELIRFQKQEPTFPHHSTADQFYSADQFLSYLQLGQHMMDGVCHLLAPAIKQGRGLDSAKAAILADCFRKNHRHWLDEVIQKSVDQNDPSRILTALVDNPVMRNIVLAEFEKSRGELPSLRNSRIRQAIVDALEPDG